MSKPNKDGWIRHRGGKCPVDAWVLVEVRLRDGHIYQGDESGPGEFWDWSNEGVSGDIMAYRIHKPAEQAVIEPAVVANFQAFNERAKLKPGKKADAADEGWKRARGRKPKYEEQPARKMQVRHRDKSVTSGWTTHSWNWGYGDCAPDADIMAFRIENVAGKPAEKPAPEIKVTHIYGESGVIHAESVSSSCGPVKAEWSEIQDSGPLIWRDRIREIDRTVEAFEEERVALVQRLEVEGFLLIERAVQPAEDMSDCLNWKKGDKVMANDDSAGFGGGFHEGGIYVMREDCTNKDHSIKVFEDDNGVENGWGSKFFKFHSRPSK